MKTLLSSSIVRLSGLALLIAALLVPPVEAATPDCEEFAGCQLCENDNCEIIICDDSVNMECNF